MIDLDIFATAFFPLVITQMFDSRDEEKKMLRLFMAMILMKTLTRPRMKMPTTRAMLISSRSLM